MPISFIKERSAFFYFFILRFIRFSFLPWGLEDSDLAIRLVRAGVGHKSARFAAPVLHLWHRENDRGSLPENRRRLEEIIHSDRIRAVSGLSQYMGNAEAEREK